MSIERLGDWLTGLYKFPPGAMKYCLGKIIEQLERLARQEIVEEARRARRKCEVAIDKRLDWDQTKQQDPLTRSGTRELDDKIDSTLTQIKDAAEIFAGIDRDNEQKRVAEEFLNELFPAGVYPITSKKFGEQHADVEAILERLKGPFSKHVDTMSLNGLVEQLEELNREFGEKLDTTGDHIDYDEVEAAIVEAEDAFHKVVVRLMYEYADDMNRFNQIVESIHDQTERTRRYLKRSGTIPEVDPETGEPVDPPGDGTGEPVGEDSSGGSNDGGTSSETDGGESSGGSGDGETSGETDGGESSGDSNDGETSDEADSDETDAS